MAEDAKVVYQAVGRAAGINVLFDPDFNSKRIQVDLTNVSLLDALRIVGTMSNTFWRPVTSNTIFVAQNTRAKRTELDEQAVQTFYLTNAWQQNDLNDVQTALRNVLTNIKVYGVQSQNALVMRGTPDELLLAQKLINDLDKARPEVVVDIAVLEVSKNWERNLGIQWPSSVSVGIAVRHCTTLGTAAPAPVRAQAPAPAPVEQQQSDPLQPGPPQFQQFRGHRRLGHGQPAAHRLQYQDPAEPAHPRHRRAESHHEDRRADSDRHRLLPDRRRHCAGQFAGQHPVPVPRCGREHRDDAHRPLRPRRHAQDEDRSHRAERVRRPSAASPSRSSPRESSDQVVRLREGEASILGGIQNQQDQVSWSGIPGLSSIPILKYLFGSKDHTITDDEVVFVVVPHIVRSQDLRPVNLRSVDTGVGQAIELRHIAVEGPGANTPPQVQPVTTNSSIGTVPGTSASGAASAAMAQMKAAAEGNPAAAPIPQTNLGVPSETPPRPPIGTPPAARTPPAPGSKVNFLMNSPGPVPVNSSFQVPIVISGAADIASIPLQLQYDATKLSLVNVDSGDFLSRDGQAVSLAHRDDGPGTVTINASRPPGTQGINGSRCRVRAHVSGQSRRGQHHLDHPLGSYQQQAATCPSARNRFDRQC